MNRTFTKFCAEKERNSHYNCNPRNGERLYRAEYCNAWIAPDGRQFYVESVSHSHVALDHANADPDALEREGWIHFSLAYRNPIANLLNPNLNFKPTQAQIDRLWDIVTAIDTAIDDTRFIRPSDHKETLATFIRNHHTED